MALLSTANSNGPPDNDANYVTQNGNTDKYVDIYYDTQTNSYPSNQALHDDDIMCEPTTASLTSPYIKNYQGITLYEPETALTPKTKYESTATTFLKTQTSINVDDKITTKYTLRSKQTKTVKHGKIDTTQPTQFPPTTPIPLDACDTEYHEVTNTPVYITALIRPVPMVPEMVYSSSMYSLSVSEDNTLETNCTFHVTAPNSTAIAIRLIDSGVNDISTYFYIENVGTPPQDCTDRYVLVSVEHTPCAAIIGGSQFRFHFQNSDMLVEVRALDVQISACFGTQGSANRAGEV